MRLWEVIKELTEDPTKVFTDGHGNCLKYTVEGLLAWHRLSGELCGLYTFKRNDNTDWQPVRQPVTWQEAIQAWVDGKKVSYSYMGYDKRFVFEDSNTMMSIEKVKNAEWYVED